MSADVLFDSDPTPEATPPLARAFTERDVLDRLRTRHAKVSGNGPEWAYAEHVKNDAGHYAQSTIDALGMHLWSSKGHAVHAYEVKVSRSDFRRELADNCSKSACWREWVDYFWIVAPVGVVPLDEVPSGWGLLVTRGPGLAVARQARRLTPSLLGYRTPEPMPRGMVAAMLRSCARTAMRP